VDARSPLGKAIHLARLKSLLKLEPTKPSGYRFCTSFRPANSSSLLSPHPPSSRLRLACDSPSLLVVQPSCSQHGPVVQRGGSPGPRRGGVRCCCCRRDPVVGISRKSLVTDRKPPISCGLLVSNASAARNQGPTSSAARLLHHGGNSSSSFQAISPRDLDLKEY
jgi:hypothetical protein